MFVMLRNSLIKKEMRINVFSIPLCWTLADNLHSSGIRCQSDDSLSSSSTSSSSSTKLADKKAEVNPYYTKYADKIKKVVEKEGINISEKIEDNLKGITAMNSIPASERIKTKPRKSSEVKESAGGPKIGGFPGSRCLKDIVNLEMLLKLDAENISSLWSEYHRLKTNCVYAVIPAEKYKQMYETGRQYQTFIYPVPKTEEIGGDDKSGYQIFLGQFSFHQIHFTPLISYQLHQENSPASLTLRHYPEISEEKGIVLMEGYFDDKILSPLEAQCLANQVQIFYGVNDLTKNLLLHKFNKNPETFNYQDVIDQFEKGLL